MLNFYSINRQNNGNYFVGSDSVRRESQYCPRKGFELARRIGHAISYNFNINYSSGNTSGGQMYSIEKDDIVITDTMQNLHERPQFKHSDISTMYKASREKTKINGWKITKEEGE